MTTRQAYIYNPVGTYVSPLADSSTDTTYEDYLVYTGYSQQATIVDSSAGLDYNVYMNKSYEHIGFNSTQINVDDVIYQVNNDERFPSFKGVTLEMVKAGDNTVYRELKFMDASSNRPGGGGSSSSGGGSIDTSTYSFANNILTNKLTGYYYNIKTMTSNDPESVGYDLDENGVPDIQQWSTV